jgi:hypothetical protein
MAKAASGTPDTCQYDTAKNCSELNISQSESLTAVQAAG